MLGVARNRRQGPLGHVELERVKAPGNRMLLQLTEVPPAELTRFPGS
jgi:hypothetical protein